MKMDSLIYFENKKVKVRLRNGRKIIGTLTFKDKTIMLIGEDSKKIAILPQEIVEIEEL